MFHDTQPAELDTDGSIDPWAPFRVPHESEMQALLRQVRDADAPVMLASPSGVSLSCTLWSIDRDNGRLSFSADAGTPQLQTLVDADEAIGVTYLESVKLQFDLHDLLLVRGGQGTALQAAMPHDMYRFQRRESFRVRPAGRHAPVATLRHPAMPEMQLSLRLLDLSVGGCALLLPADVPEVRPGLQLHGVRIQLDLQTEFHAGLLLHHVSSMNSPAQGHRIGCEWLALDADAQRALQLYVNQTQKRHRLLTLS